MAKMTATKYKQKMLSDTFNNRAKYTNEHECKTHNCEFCSEPIVFALASEKGESFSVGLTTILNCLKIAQEQGHIPKIAPSFWMQMANSYNIEYPKE